MITHQARLVSYLYKIKSVWDPKKGIARKITEKYLGRITPEGLIPQEKEKHKPSTVKESGASQSLISQNNDILQRLKQCFPSIWKEVFAISCMRFLHQSPLSVLSLSAIQEIGGV